MKHLILILLIAGLAWFGYTKYRARQAAALSVMEALESASPPDSTGRASTASPSPPAFNCDGRTHCSQMTSCAEATYFLQHCPGVQMDGNGDGVPCEKQWCR